MNNWGTVALIILATSLAGKSNAEEINTQEIKVGGSPSATSHSAQNERDFSIPGGELQHALLAFSQQVDLQLLYASDLTAGLQTRGVQGRHTPQAALDILLAGSGLTFRFTNKHTVTLEKVEDNTLPAVKISADVEPSYDNLPAPYSGGQVASGGRLGILGNTDLMDAPFSITSYTSKTIEDQQARSVADVLANEPSVRSASARTNINEDFTIRGFPVASQDIAFNGMYAVTPYFRVPVEMAERVEVLKGPAALLNGMPPSGNIGGVVNIVPKRAGEQPLTRLSADYLSDSIFGVHLDAARRFGQNNAFGARINGMFRSGDSNVDYQSEEDKLGSVALDYRGERLRMSADLLYQKQGTEGVVRQFTIAPSVTQLPAAPDGSLSYPGAWTDLAMEDSSAVFHGEYDISDAITLYAGAGTRASKMNALAGNPMLMDNVGNYSYSPAWQLFDVDSSSYEAGINSQFSTAAITHQVNLSTTQVRQDSTIFFETAFPTASGNLAISNNDPAPDLSGITVNKNNYTDITLTSYALADTLGFMDDKIKLTLGIRQQQVQIQNYNYRTGATSGEEYDESKPTPVAGLVWKPWSQEISLYASYVEGLSQGPTAPNDPTLTNPGEVFEPTVSKQVEIGAKAEWDSIGGSIALFQLEKPSGIRVGNTFEVSGEQNHKGVELSVFGSVVPSLRLLGGASFIDSEMTTTTDGVNQGKDAVGVPEWQFNLGAEWNTSFMQNLTLTSLLVYTSEQYANAENTLQLPEWTRVDIGARYTTSMSGKPLILRADLENAFNEAYWGISNAGYLYAGDTRTLKLSATIDF